MGSPLPLRIWSRMLHRSFVWGPAHCYSYKTGWRYRKGENQPLILTVEGRHMTIAFQQENRSSVGTAEVYVDGKLEGQRGRVVEVCYNFKIKVSDYQRIIAVADPRVQGIFLLAGDHFITFDRNTLPYEQAILWFKAPDKEDEEIISGNDDCSFPLRDLSRMGVDSVIGERGHRYYLENRVKYLRLDGTHGRAIVSGSKPYRPVRREDIVERDFDRKPRRGGDLHRGIGSGQNVPKLVNVYCSSP